MKSIKRNILSMKCIKEAWASKEGNCVTVVPGTNNYSGLLGH